MNYPGLHRITNEEYHAAPGVSRSGLWTLYTKSPAHFRFGKPAKKKEFDLGTAAEWAVRSPEEFADKAFRGPADRRGNKWKNAEEHCEHHGLLLLTEGDHDACQRIRDAVHAKEKARTFIESAAYGTAAFAVDEETGCLVKCYPDGYSASLGLLGDIKTDRDASAAGFARSIASYGYHVQEAVYLHAWNNAALCNRGEVHAGVADGFLFIVAEKEPPWQVGIYELHPRATAEGYAIYRKALAVYAECMRTDTWPGYPDDVQQIDIARWGYRETDPRETEAVET